MERSGCLLGKFPLRTQLPSWQGVETQPRSPSPNPGGELLFDSPKSCLRNDHKAALNDLQIASHPKLRSSCFTLGEPFREEGPFLSRND